MWLFEDKTVYENDADGEKKETVYARINGELVEVYNGESEKGK